MLESSTVHDLELTADELIAALLRVSNDELVCILDSCGVGHLGSHLLIAGIRPVEVFEFSDTEPEKILTALDEKLSGDRAAIFSLSYDFGARLQGIVTPSASINEPDVFLALFQALVVHDYNTGRTKTHGNKGDADAIADALLSKNRPPPDRVENKNYEGVRFSVTRDEYVAAVEQIREYIRSGDTYQANLTQQLRCNLPDELTPQEVFTRLRRDHPAPFAAYLSRRDSTVVSASPERFIRIARDGSIDASPIKGTRPRGTSPEEDERLRSELLGSEKDIAENTMIVDLMRNDLGRVCEYGSVIVEKLCDIEEHPTLFHLVSTVRGQLRGEVSFSEILRSVFPCGSITGAPKLRTMEIINELEPVRRGLSMGAIGCYLPARFSNVSSSVFDLSVAIRTMVIREKEAVFNVGGGVVIDSDPEKEFEESILKAKALLRALS
jgi:para-aminobenzoate synthetase component I